MKVIIVGGVAGGATAAARLRRVDEFAEIIMLEKGEFISFANCGLPYYVGGTIEEREALLVQTPEVMEMNFNMTVRTFNEVTKIDKENKTVTVKNLKTNEEYVESYDKLILSPGSVPLKPPIPGIDSPNIFTLWNIPDVDKIKDFVDKKDIKKAAVIGGGFIGVEMAENLHDLGIEVTIIEMLDQVMAPIDFEMAQIVHQHMRNKNIDLQLGDGVKSFTDKNDKTIVTLQSGKEVEADLVMLSIGVRPQTGLAKDSGLELGPRGHIVVDDYLKTSDENIYAIGDAIEVVDFVNGKKTAIPLAGPANKQGRIVSNNILGNAKERYTGTQGTSIAKVFDLTVAGTGHNEKLLIRDGLVYGKDYQKMILHPKHHVGYYPGALPMTMKILFANDGKILGTQIVGYDGVDKRIDVIATAMRFGGTIDDLKELELAYAPPYNGAKDPVNFAGFVGENILSGFVKFAHHDEVKEMDLTKSIILDIREPLERELGYIKGSINIPLDQLRTRFNELDKSKKIVVYCAIGVRGYLAARILQQNGFDHVYNLSGGYETYSVVYCQDEKGIDNCGGVYSDENIEYGEFGGVEHHQAPADYKGERHELNTSGLSCPGPIMKVYHKMNEINPGDVLYVKSSDPGFVNDIGAWARKTGNTLLDSGKKDKGFYAELLKGTAKAPMKEQNNQVVNTLDGQTIVVFSGDLDKAIASFIIANGAAAMGKKVTIFFTFWGLNILKKENYNGKKDSFLNKMFGIMMPKGPSKLKLSNMNMFGMGPMMIKGIMKKHNVDPVGVMMQQALDNGVKMIACNMSMDLLGIQKEELIDGIELGGVAMYLGATSEANSNLFI